MYNSTLSLALALDGGVGGQQHAPAALPPGKTRYPLYKRLGGPQGRSGQVEKISPLSGFEPRTVQPLVSRYTDRAIPAPKHTYIHTHAHTHTHTHIYIYIYMYTTSFRINKSGL